MLLLCRKAELLLLLIVVSSVTVLESEAIAASDSVGQGKEEIWPLQSLAHSLPWLVLHVSIIELARSLQSQHSAAPPPVWVMIILGESENPDQGSALSPPL